MVGADFVAAPRRALAERHVPRVAVAQRRRRRDDAAASAGQAFYAYETKRFVVVTQAEHYDRDFRMDTAFLNQTGITRELDATPS